MSITDIPRLNFERPTHGHVQLQKTRAIQTQREVADVALASNTIATNNGANWETVSVGASSPSSPSGSTCESHSVPSFLHVGLDHVRPAKNSSPLSRKCLLLGHLGRPADHLCRLLLLQARSDSSLSTNTSRSSSSTRSAST